MKGFTEVTIQNRPFVIEYKGEHYVVRHRSGRTVRMAKADIIKKFHLHHDALDRYIGGGFKKPHCNADEDVTRVRRSLWYVENVAFFITTAITMLPQVALVLAIVIGYVNGATVRPYVAPMVFGSMAAILASVMLPEVLAERFDFVLGIEREG
ncbi:hypothetical protein [Mitsuokella jalaludinii]|uniref:hypothetical protein n=1 Tax=Mitsuokella jalaludinii TaxID=187979 RepID=UPI003078D17C